MGKQRMQNIHVAIDLGATSGRVITEQGGVFEEIHRFLTPMVKRADGIYWDFTELFAGIIAGLQKLSAVAGNRPVVVFS